MAKTNEEKLSDAITNLMYSDNGVDELDEMGFALVGDGLFEANDGSCYKVTITATIEEMGDDFDPENIYNSDSIRQSIEEDRK